MGEEIERLWLEGNLSIADSEPAALDVEHEAVELEPQGSGMVTAW